MTKRLDTPPGSEPDSDPIPEPGADFTFPLMPWPRSVVGLDEPSWLATQGYELTDQAPLPEIIMAGLARLQQRLPVATGEPGAPLPLTIRCAAKPSKTTPIPSLGDDESYRLRISPQGIELVAKTVWGVLHGLTSLAQLWHAGTWLPVCELMDAPRFAWRGLMLDPARRFLPLAHLLRTLEAMSLCKLNVLHLHLSDDQGFRFTSTSYPELASSASYSTAELQQLVAHAAQLGIRVVPELDIPGHCTSWLTAYPQWGSAPTTPSTRFGVHKACLDPTNPEVMQAIAVLLGELAEVFPDEFQHLGGDEVHPAWWSQDDDIQAYMQQHQLAEPADLQAQFNTQVAQLAAQQQRRMVAWDEVLHPDFGERPDAVVSERSSTLVQNWRGATSRDRALKAGHDCVVSSGYYLDLMYPVDLHYRFDLGLPERDLLALEDEMLEDVRLAHVSEGMRWTLQWRDAPSAGQADASGELLGGEACLWGELVDVDCLDLRLWSRMPAIAERFWSTAERTDLKDMYRRLQAWQHKLASLAGIELWAQQRAALAASGIDEAWHTLTDLVEPVKWYARLLGEQALEARLSGAEMPQARPYQTTTALDTWVDHLWPESFMAVDLASWLPTAQAEEIVELAQRWSRLAAQPNCPSVLQPMAERLALLASLVGRVASGELAGAEARALAEPLAEPVGDVLLAVGWPVVQWLQDQ